MRLLSLWLSTADVYNLTTILFAVVISLPIAKTTEQQEAKEADYRHAQMRMKVYAEQVRAFDA